jgi:hypothetical protein
MIATETKVGEAVDRAVASLDFETLRREYWDQNECLILPQFLPRSFVEATLAPVADRLRPLLNRNYIPAHKKGGSVSYFTILKQAPEFLELYRSASFRNFVARLANAPLHLCPDTDPHSCALYYYTEPGDYIGFHYDTSYYKGARYTILLGLIDQAPSCQLVCQLHKDDPSRPMKEVRLSTAPGDLVIFNGDKLWHAVTLLGEGEYRVVLTLEYVTTQEMGSFKRMYSNLKDAFGYFGLRAVFKRVG